MNNKEYAQFCKLQETIRQFGFPQVYDQMLTQAVKEDKPRFRMSLLNLSDGDHLRQNLRFFRFEGEEDYTFDHFQVIKRGDIPIKATIINGVDTALLEDRFRKINWHGITAKMLEDDIERGSGRFTAEIETMLSDLDRVDAAPEGKHIADLLLVKYLLYSPFINERGEHHRLEEIERPYCDTVKISCRMPSPPTALDALFIIETPSKDRKDYMAGHEVYEVGIKGSEFTISDDSEEVTVNIYQDQSKYFRSLKNAVEHIEAISLKQFNPIIVVAEKLPMAVKEAIIYDCIDDQVVATKGATWDLGKRETLLNNIITWQIEEGKMSAADFEQKSGLLISGYGRSDPNRHIYQVLPRLPASDQLGNRPTFKRKNPPGQRGPHL